MGEIAGCESHDPVVTAHLGATFEFHLQNRHTIQNILVSHKVYENGTFVDCYSTNSDKKPHMYEACTRYENRLTITMSPQRNTLYIQASNAESADGGIYSVRITTDHMTFTKCYRLYILGTVINNVTHDAQFDLGVLQFPV